MAIPAISNNSPAAGNIAWGAFNIQYEGTSFAIPAGSTSHRWVWWRYNTGGSTSVIEAGADIPTNLKDEDLVLFGNKNGIGIRVQSTTYVDGELLVDGSIFADALAANQITSEKISTAGLDAGVIKFGTMSGDRIGVNTLQGDRILTNSLVASKLAVTDFTNFVGLEPSFEASRLLYPGLTFDSRTYRGAGFSVNSTGQVAVVNVGQKFTVVPDEEFYIVWMHRRVGSNEQTFLNLRTENGVGGPVDYFLCDEIKINGAPSTLAGLATTPNDTWVKVEARARISNVTAKIAYATIRKHVNSTTGGYVLLDEMAIFRKSGGELIVDGSIVANKIAVGTITGDKIAGDTITGNKIAGSTITGDKIAANTIAASKIIVTDMTNLAVDGELLDPTVSNWDLRNTPALTRVDPAGARPYLEGRNTAFPQMIWFKNENFFGIAEKDEFHLSFEVSTPATNTETLSLYPSIEVFDHDGAGQFWRGIDTGEVAIPPNTDWMSVEGRIVITESSLASAQLNVYVNGITAAAGTQKLRIRQIALRRRGGGELIVDGALTAQQINVNSLTADIINTGILQTGFTITGALTIAGANMGWSKAQGLWLGNGTVFYGDARTNQIEGDLVTESISVKDGFSLGGDADIHGVMELSNGVTAPTARMALGETWPKALSEGLTPSTTPGSGTNDVGSQWLGLHSYSATHWAVPFNFFGAGIRLINKSNWNFVQDLPCDPNWTSKFYPTGFAKLGTSFYMLGSDGKRSSDIYIYKLSSTGTIVKQAERKIVASAGFFGKRAKLVSDGVKVGLLWCNSEGTLYLRWFNADLTAQVGTDIPLLTNVGVRSVGDAFYGPMQSGGANRLVVSLYDGDANMVRAWTLGGTASAPTATRVPADDFPRAHDATVIALALDDVQNRILSVDQYGYFYTYSKYINGGTLNAQYTFYDGDNAVYPAGTIINGVDKSGQASGEHETAASPLSTFLLSKRAWPTIMAPPAPDELVTDVTKVDKANRLGIYASVGNTPRFQSYLPVKTRALPLTDGLYTTSALVNASGKPSFASASVPSPGLLRSQKKKPDNITPVFQVLGDGSGNWGDLTVSSTGLVSIDNDSGWIVLPLAAGYEQGAAGAAYTPRIRVIGNIVELRGIVKPISGLFVAGTHVQIGNVPYQYAPSAFKWGEAGSNVAAARARVLLSTSGGLSLLPDTAAMYYSIDLTYFLG